MAIINFPSSPSLYQTFTIGSKTWVWNGYAWDIQLQTGVSFAFAQAAYNQANTANVLAQSAFNQANSANTKAYTSWSYLANGSYTLLVQNDGQLVLPISTTLGFNAGSFTSTANVAINAAGNIWKFDTLGNLISPYSVKLTQGGIQFPDSSQQNTAGASLAYSQASFNTANNALANTGVLVTSNTLTQYIIANTTNSISTSTGALQVQGGVGVTGNIYSNAIYTNGLFYSANGNPISTGGGTTFTASNTAPSTPKYGDQWYFIASDIVYEYATNGTASFWLDVTSDSVATNVTTVSAETQLSPFLFMGAT